MATIDPITGLPSSNTQQLQAGDMPTPPTPKGAVTSPYTGYTSSQAPATVTTRPVSVVSSNLASEDLNSRVVPGYNQIQQNLNTYISKNMGSRPGDSVYAPVDPNNPTIGPNNGLQGYRGYDGNVYQTQEEALAKKYQGGDGKYYSTQDEATLNTPQTGNYFAYNQAGQRIELPIGQTAPTGFSTSQPNTPNSSAIETVNDSLGGSIRKLSDGTYAEYDKNGQMVGKTNELVFNNLKQSNSLAQKIADIANGTYTLNDSEKAQIESVKALYQKTIRDTQTLYGNLTGSQAILQNLYGMGNNAIGQGAITGVVEKGIQAVADLTSQMESKVSEMTQAFKDKNMVALKNAYETYSKKETDRQSVIQKMKDDLSLISRETQQQKATADQQTDNDIRGLIQTAQQAGVPLENLQKMQAALQNHDYAAAAEAGGEYLKKDTGVVGEFYAYQRDERARGTPENKMMTLNQYMTADANRKARIAAAGASIVAGTEMTAKQQAVFNAMAESQLKSPSVAAQSRAYNLKTLTEQAKADPMNPQTQLALIYGVIQALDMYQSATREGEIDLVRDTQGLLQKAQNFTSRIENGNPLGRETALGYVKLAKQMTDSIDANAEKVRNDYRARAGVNGISKPWSDYETATKDLNQKFDAATQHKEKTNGLESKSKTDLLDTFDGNKSSNSNTSFFNGL